MTYWHEKVALITGGSAGLGRALAEAFAQHGATVVIAARGKARLDRVAAKLRRDGHEVLAAETDITRSDEVDALLAHVKDRFGRLDVLVNCAGSSARGKILETTTEDFQKLWDLNLLAAVRCTRAAVPLLLERQGHLVNIGSLASKTASAYLGAYPASKFALAAYSQQLRLELGPSGLHVLLVCPGPIARDDGGARYADAAADLPEGAGQPGGGAKLGAIDPAWLAERILQACEKRRPELVVPGKSRLLFAIAQLSPRCGDWIVRKMTSR